MGVKNLPLIAERLIGAGRAGAEPAAVVERGTLAGQRTVTGTLADIAARGGRRRRSGRRRSRWSGPVAELRETLAWLERRPLHGAGGGGHARAGPGERAGGAAARAGRRGGRGAGDPDRAARRSTLPRSPAAICVCLTSPNGVRLLLRRAARATRARSPGHASRRSARAPRRRCARTGSRRRGAGALGRRGAAGGAGGRAARRASACWSRAPPRRATCCRTALRERGAEVDVVALYETVAEPLVRRASGA